MSIDLDHRVITSHHQPLVWSPEVETVVRRATRTWCSRLGVKGEDMDDCEQSAAISAWQKCENGKVYYREGLWFIARNTVLDFRARSYRMSTCPLYESISYRMSNTIDKLVAQDISLRFPELVTLAAARADGYEWELIAENFSLPCGSLRVRFSRLVREAVEYYGDDIYDLLRINR